MKKFMNSGSFFSLFSFRFRLNRVSLGRDFIKFAMILYAIGFFSRLLFDKSRFREFIFVFDVMVFDNNWKF